MHFKTFEFSVKSLKLTECFECRGKITYYQSIRENTAWFYNLIGNWTFDPTLYGVNAKRMKKEEKLK